MGNINKFKIDIHLACRLIAAQFPQWVDLPIQPIKPEGGDNKTFRLGDQMTIRLPRAREYSHQVKKEQYWLPKLAPLLPLPIPTPLAMGKPTEEYPWHWSIYQWLIGSVVSPESIIDLNKFAAKLAGFLISLQKINTEGAPKAGIHNFYRGGDISIYDAETRQAISILNDKIDVKLATEIWDKAMASSWQSSPVWVHGDITPGNLLVREGELSAVIDFGSSAVGDPACDLAIAWTFFKKESRDIFRIIMNLDNSTWARGRGWALWKALIICAGLPGTNPREIQQSQQVIEEIFFDYK